MNESKSLKSAAGCIRTILFAFFLLFVAGPFSWAAKDKNDPVSSAPDPVIRSGCVDGTRLEDCLSERNPASTVYFPFDEWAARSWLSPDGKILLVSTIKRLSGDSKKDDYPALSAVDLEGKRLLWRKSLEKDIDIVSCSFLDPDSVLVTDGDAYFAALRPQTGDVIWKETCKGRDHCAAVSWIDSEKRVVVLDGLNEYLVLNAVDGSTLGKMKSMDRKFNPAYSAGVPLATPQGLYLTDGGMIRVSRDSGEITWNTPYPTVSDTKGGSGFWGKLLGAAISGAMAGALGGATGSPFVAVPMMGNNASGTFNFGRVATTVDAGEHIVAAALGTVYCMDKDTGKISWATWLPVTQVDDLRVVGDRVYALGGGVSLTKSYVNLEVVIGSAYRNGLYALQLADGHPVPGFHPPFNSNGAEKILTESDVRKLSPQKIGKREIQWLRADAKILKEQRKLDWEPPEEEKDEEPDEAEEMEPEPEPAAGDQRSFGFDPLYGLAVGKDALYVGTVKEVLVLDPDTGAVRGSIPAEQAAPLYSLREAGDFIILRGFSGITVLSLSDGSRLWSRSTQSIDRFSVFQDPGHSGRLHIPRPDLHADEELDSYRAAMFWLDPARNNIILPESSDTLAAFSLSDGSTLWRAPVRKGVPVHFVLTPEQRVLFEHDHNTLRIYRVP